MNKVMPALRHSRAAAVLTLASVLAAMIAPLLDTHNAKADPSQTLASMPAGIGTNGVSVPQSRNAAFSGQFTSIDPSIGSATVTYPFDLPMARGDIQPALALTYSSNAGDGDAGISWKLNLPSIERRSAAGLTVPAFRDQNALAIDQNWNAYDTYTFDGGMPLVPICAIRDGACPGAAGEQFPSFVVGSGWMYYRNPVDTGNAERFFFSPNHRAWIVQTKTETMLFGDPDVDATSGNVFRWRLSRRADYHSGTNVISYVWNGSQLTDIYDTLSPGGSESQFASFAHHTHLWWTANPYQNAHPPVWRAVATSRLTRVDITSKDPTGVGGRELVRMYNLRYSDLPPPRWTA